MYDFPFPIFFRSLSFFYYLSMNKSLQMIVLKAAAAAIAAGYINCSFALQPHLLLILVPPSTTKEEE